MIWLLGDGAILGLVTWLDFQSKFSTAFGYVRKPPSGPYSFAKLVMTDLQRVLVGVKEAAQILARIGVT